MCREPLWVITSIFITLLLLCAFFITGQLPLFSLHVEGELCLVGGLAVYEGDDLDTSDVLLAVSAVLMLLTSVAFAVAVKIWVYAHNLKVENRSDETDLAGETISELQAGMLTYIVARYSSFDPEGLLKVKSKSSKNVYTYRSYIETYMHINTYIRTW